MKLRAIAAALAVLATVTACQPKERPTDPCLRYGCEADEQRGAPGALYVPQCHDVDGQTGPCVDTVGDSGMWIFIPAGNRWPLGQRMEPCPTWLGGPVPCVWVIDSMGDNPNAGDSGAYVYGVREV